MDLRSLITEKRKRLNPCTTVVTNTSGEKYEVADGKMKLIEKVHPFVVDTKPDLQVARILPGLYLSSQDPAVSLEILERHDIRHILSLGINLPVKFERIAYHYVDFLDLPEFDIREAANVCVRTIDDNRHENILVHCNAGVSRSPAIVIFYLMTRESLTCEQAYARVKSARNCIKPNVGFIEQIKTLCARAALERGTLNGL